VHAALLVLAVVEFLVAPALYTAAQAKHAYWPHMCLPDKETKGLLLTVRDTGCPAFSDPPCEKNDRIAGIDKKEGNNRFYFSLPPLPFSGRSILGKQSVLISS
jgi:hypothetical protein